jgi:hypothetical protein
VTAADVDRALTGRSLLITWLNRGTLHLVRSEDYWWLHPLLAPLLRTASARRLAQEGVSAAGADQAVTVIEAGLTAEGPLTRPQLRDRIDAAGVRTAGQAIIHLLILACLRGVAVRGPMVGAEHAYVLVRDWLGEPPPFDRDRALAELAGRYLAGHGPASDRDLAKWSGLPLGDARRGLAAISGRLDQRADGLVDLAGVPREREVPPPRLLGAFDPLLHGWMSRDPVLGPHASIVTVNGLFRPFALVGGKAVATWGVAAGQVTTSWLEEVPDPARAALDADAADVRRYLGFG